MRPTGVARRPFSVVVAMLFFGLVPALIGLLLGATRAGVAIYFPWVTGIVFWVAASAAAWACLYAGSAIAGVLLRPWRPPLWLILLVGALLGSAVARYCIFGVVVLLGDHMVAGRTPQPLPPFELSTEFAVRYLQGWTGVFATWTAVGLLFDRWFGFPRYSREADSGGPSQSATRPGEATAVASPAASTAPSPAAPTTQVPSSLLDRLPERLGRHVVALEAEDHYVRVHTDRGSALVLARLSDAIEELAALDGVRVHRSWWARREAVASVAVNGKGLLLTLTTGLQVPVSQAYKEVARQAGLSAGRGQRIGEVAAGSRPGG